MYIISKVCKKKRYHDITRHEEFTIGGTRDNGLEVDADLFPEDDTILVIVDPLTVLPSGTAGGFRRLRGTGGGGGAAPRDCLGLKLGFEVDEGGDIGGGGE